MRTDLKENIESVRERIDRAANRSGRSGDNIRLIVVTKTFPASCLQELIDLGVSDIGENKVQELEAKVPRISGPCTMHLIGHLQSNKVARAVNLVQWIQTLDSVKLVEKVEKYAATYNTIIQGMVQVNTTAEASKYGCAPDQCSEICARAAASSHIRFRGFMTIGPFGGNEKQIRKSFEALRTVRDRCVYGDGSLELSMGMSDDFEIAIEEGATMVRVGSLIVGHRRALS